MIRVLLVDDHPALRAGLQTVLRGEPGLVPVGAASGEHDLWPLMHRVRPDVIVLDYHLPGTDGFVLCHRIKADRLLAPAVLLYSAYADTSLALPATLAGANGLVDKGAPALELFEAIRAVYRGDSMMPQIPRELVDAAARRANPEDLPLIGMLMERTPPGDIAEALHITRDEVYKRTERLLGDLSIKVPASPA